MLNIKILGSGCSRCRKLEDTVKELVAQNKIDAVIQKISDIQEMMNYGIMATPGLVINEKLKSSGVIPKNDQILNWLKEEV
jgi:small redox-active disulfide protein 2